MNRFFRWIRKRWILATKERGIGQDERWVRILWCEHPTGGRCVAVYEDEL